MASSMTMCLRALGFSNESEDTVNRVMGAQPMRGASWESALACAQHYGCRATLVVPATIPMLKAWTDVGTPIMIAWNPEGRDWSHASAVYDVTDRPDGVPEGCTIEGEGPGLYVWVADPNIPHPEKTTRIVQEDLFYKRWFEKWPDYLVRRPALAIEREITPDGRQVRASMRTASKPIASLEYSGPAQKVWSVSDPSDDLDAQMGRILFDRKSGSYTSELYIGGDEDRRHRLGTTTAIDEREGLKRALMFFAALPSPSRVAARFLAGVR